MNQSHPHPAEGLTGPQTNLLSYEDIYRASLILSPDSGYDIHKVVDMLEVIASATCPQPHQARLRAHGARCRRHLDR